MFCSQARELFEQIVSWLDSDSICGLEHSQIESNLLENRYELLRRLLQGYLALLNQGMISLNFQRFLNGFKR
ncbi:hypothetical protein RintRC_6903 [Richelia intracellularis]|nr:hypothetical protein RintRC_6903 [Richelia intracellularis]